MLWQNLNRQFKKFLVVIGCSTSEVRGSKIGSDSNQELGNLLFSVLAEAQKQSKSAVQCCEH